MNIIGLSCSPQVEEHIDILMRQVLRAAEEERASVEFIKLSDMKIDYCYVCWMCEKTGQCHIVDDMRPIYPKLLQADGIVIGSPYRSPSSITGQPQLFLDRIFAFIHQRQLRNKVGGYVLGSDNGIGLPAVKIIESFFSDHWLIYAGCVNGSGEALSNPPNKNILSEAENLGKRMCETIRLAENYDE